MERILEAASRAPSAANSQPWEVYVASGQTLERIRKGFADKHAEKEKPAADVPYKPAATEKAMERVRFLDKDQAEMCGEARSDFGRLNREFFEAPMVVYICIDKALGEWAMYDIGAYAENLMLAATAEGLGTIPAVTLMLYGDVLRSELGIPENLKAVIGIAIGYEDKSHGINKYRSKREPIEETVRFLG
jgi:nitroreductase